jgi:hypothetical protein
MSQRLFSVHKVGAFVDTYSPGLEKRRGEDVSVLRVKFRVQPFDAKLASALDAGVGGDSNIRPTVFSLNTTDPKPNFTRHDFKLKIERQNLHLFASSDTTDARVVLDQAKIAGCYVRTQKDMNALALVFTATFGPVGRDQLELVHSLHRSQTFITFEEAEPLLGGEGDDDDDTTDADEKARRPANTPPPPMWADEADTKGLVKLLADAGARVDVSAAAAWSPEEFSDAAKWAREQIAANAEAEPGTSTSIAWPEHVSAAHRNQEPARHKLHSHAGGKKKTAKASTDRGRAAKRASRK